jgi:formate-dependent nitrite reductase membrane component NrfD
VAETPTYYGLPAVKRSHYGWLVATYFFVGGLAGAAQVIAEIADLVSEERAAVRAGRYLALLGSLISPLLLIRDLHTPSRWFNMLRIFRPTSPMSIGSWTLAGFGTFSGLAAICEFLGLRGLARLLGLPAAALGVLMSTYTGVLLSATSTPMWAVAYRHLPPLFGATAVASASAALSLLLARSASGPRLALRRLDRLALVAGLVQLAAALSLERVWQANHLQTRVGLPQRVLIQGAGIGLPLLVHSLAVLTGRRSDRLSLLAAVCTLNGAYLERATIVFTGNRSAERPEEYLRVAS